MDFQNSQFQREDEMHNTNQYLQESSSLARRLDDQGGSKITQYFNVANKSFENSQQTLKNPKQQTTRSDNFKLPPFSSFPQEKFEYKNIHQENPTLYLNKNYYVSSNQLYTPNKNLLLNSRPENLKESRVEQSLQKVFNLNRSTHRIPFKKKQNPNEQMNLRDAFKGYNFYEPSYDEYFPKQHRKFWIQAFQKFYEKRGSLQTLEFPSFQNKDQSKSFDHMPETHKQSQESFKQKQQSGQDKITNLIGRFNWINTVLLAIILIVGLILLIKR